MKGLAKTGFIGILVAVLLLSATAVYAPGAALCNDGNDNDGDGLTDYPTDPGCSSRKDTTETGTIACDNNADDDSDGKTDYKLNGSGDPGCTGASDTNERGTLLCDNGADDADADSLSDYPNDLGCTGPSDNIEVNGQCDDLMDNDGDTLTDYSSDPGCASYSDASERGTAQCDDGLDNDADNWVDYPDDPSCASATDNDESPADTPASPPQTSQKYIYLYAGEPDIDVNPADPANLAVSGIGPTGSTTPVFYTLDGGITWNRSKSNVYMGGSDPNINYDAHGNLYYSTIDTFFDPNDHEVISVSKSVNKGANFTSKTAAINRTTIFRMPDGSNRTMCPDSNLTVADVDYPKLGADRFIGSPHASNVYVMAKVTYDMNNNSQCDGNEPFITSIVRSADGGATWKDGQSISIGAFMENIGVGPTGNVYLALGSSPATPSDAPPQYGTYICNSSSPYSPNNGIALWKSTDGGAHFGNGTCIYPANASILTRGPAMVGVDPSNANNVYVIFDAYLILNGSYIRVYSIKSTDGGATWSSPVLVDDNATSDKSRARISVSGNGRVDAAWFDYRNSNSTDHKRSSVNTMDIYYSYSLDGGNTWAANVRASNVTARYEGVGNDYIGIVSSGKKAYVSYAQKTNTSSNNDYAYVSTIQHP
ncbi:MAG: sialidase family protein [Candidatus Burarchaeum sp.]|nr:sialidase family protein [Candidatus Burarchaeum sp.]MDO8339323.1 sialidase family protein [Candidatus Burarchaeum sp.]